MDLSDSEEDDEIRSNPGNRAGNGNGEDEDDDLSQWTLDTFTSRPVGGEGASSTVSSSTLAYVEMKLRGRYVGCTPKWRNR